MAHQAVRRYVTQVEAGAEMPVAGPGEQDDAGRRHIRTVQ